MSKPMTISKNCLPGRWGGVLRVRLFSLDRPLLDTLISQEVYTYQIDTRYIYTSCIKWDVQQGYPR